MAAQTFDGSSTECVQHNEIRKLTVTLYRRRWWIFSCTVFFTLVAGVISFMVTPTYLAETTLVPAQNGSGSGFGPSALAQLGGFAGIVGLAGADKPLVTEAIALLKSRQFTEDFIRDKNLLPVLFANKWDSKSNRWKPGVKVPDLWDGYLIFDRRIRFVEKSDRTGVITLRIEWRNPVQAAAWANSLVRRVNEQMRQRALEQSAKTLRYLSAELKKTNIVVVQNALQNLIETNLKQEAFADVTTDYVFTVVDPAAPPDSWYKLRPHKSIYVITGFFFGFIISVLTAMATDGFQIVRGWVRESA